MRDPLRLVWLLLLLCPLAGHCLADAPKPGEFAWRASLALPPAARLARVSLPAQALLHLQSRDASDLRVFNASGNAVAFAFGRPGVPVPAPQFTRSYDAYPIHGLVSGQQPLKGSVQVQIRDAGQTQSLWVDLDADRGTSLQRPASALNSVIFSTRSETQLLQALLVSAELPANVAVNVTASTSPDLAQWTPVALRGRLYRFPGNDGPANQRLELAQALNLQGRYLRLDWSAQDGVSVAAVTGVVVAPHDAPRVQAPLSPGRPAGAKALEWSLDFATPITALVLTTARHDTLVPVRILARADAARGWRPLAQTLVYRLGAEGREATNPPLPLAGATLRGLRIEVDDEQSLSGLGLAVAVELEPVHLMFLADNDGPYVLAAGRSGTAPAALPASLLLKATESSFDELPQARISTVLTAPAPAGAWARFVDAGAPDPALLLWLVLALGVFVLGAATWALLRRVTRNSSAADKP